MPVSSLRPTSQPPARRLARGVYWRALALVFRWGKVPFSKLLSRFEPRAEWPGHEMTWESLEDYGLWLREHVRWKPDRLGGLVDAFPTRETIAAQFRDKGYFEEDCDGLAYFSGQNVIRFADDANKITIVTVVLDPYTFERKPLLYAAHVLLLFPHRGVWRVISNETLYPDAYDSFAEAVQNNPYCRGHPVLWAEARDKDLHLYAAGADLNELEAKLEVIWRKKQDMPYLA